MKPRETVQAWVDACNRAGPDASAAFYSEDATNHQMAEAPVSGRAAIRQRFATEFARANIVCIVENIFHVVDGRIFQRGYWDKLSFLRMHDLPLPKDP